MFEWDEGSDYIRIPEGEEITVFVKKIEKTTGKYNLKRDGVDLGYHVQVTTDKGILSVNSWGLYYAFKNAFVKEGKTYVIKCLQKGGGGKSGEYQIKEIVKEETPF